MKKLERLFDLSLDMLCIAGADGYFKVVNPAFTHVLGYEAEELLERRFIEFIHPDDVESTLAAMEQLRQDQPVIDFENRYVCKNGSYRWLAWRSAPEDDMIYAIARDVTEKKRLAQLMRSAEILRSVAAGTAATTGSRFFRSLVRHLATALGVRYCLLTECLDTPPTRVRTLAFWADGSLVDDTEFDLEGTPCQEVMEGEDCFVGERVLELFPHDRELAKLNAESYAAVPMLSSAGKVVGHLAALDVEPFPKDGLDVSLLRIFADRAAAELERRRAEEESQRLQTQVLHAQKLESLGVLAGGIAHDFNNILVGILGNSGLAQAELPPGSSARLFIDRIEHSAQRAADLANQMLAYSGKGHFVVETFDLNELLEEMYHLLETSVSKKAGLHLQPSKDVAPIRGDVTQIRQVIMNLVTNASDALEEGNGIITVEVGSRRSNRPVAAEPYPGDELPPGEYVHLKVSDTGCGMDAATRSRIFDPFFTTKRTGRGLGMAAVLGILRGHKGGIQVDSAPDCGSTFTVLIPASEERPVSRLGAPADGGPRIKILVVDDELIVRQVAELSLESSGFEVVTAEDGRQAMEVFRQLGDEIAAVVLDMTMPHMNGEETFRELRRLRPDLRVILTSGFNEQDVKSRFEGQGLSGFLKKPYRPKELVQKVNDVLAVAP